MHICDCFGHQHFYGCRNHGYQHYYGYLAAIVVMVANITIDFLLTMGTEVTNVPVFTIVTMVTRFTSAHWARLLEGAKGFISEDIS
jgi:hypothetical protein